MSLLRKSIQRGPAMDLSPLLTAAKKPRVAMKTLSWCSRHGANHLVIQHAMTPTMCVVVSFMAPDMISRTRNSELKIVEKVKDLAVQVLPRVKLDLIFGKCCQWNSERDTVTLNARRTKRVFKT